MTEETGFTSPNYLDAVAADIGALVPGCEQALLRIYAVLALAKGADVTRADVHHAWAAWRAATRPDHPSLVPFEDLSPEVQALDEPYAEAIRKVAARFAPAGPLRAAQPPGEFAQVQIMGHNEKTGWVTDGTLAGSACLDVCDDAGRLIAKVPPHSVYLYLPVLPSSALRPRLAIGPGEEPEGSIEGEYCYCDPGSDRQDLDCPQHGSPF